MSYPYPQRLQHNSRRFGHNNSSRPSTVEPVLVWGQFAAWLFDFHEDCLAAPGHQQVWYSAPYCGQAHDAARAKCGLERGYQLGLVPVDLGGGSHLGAVMAHSPRTSYRARGPGRKKVRPIWWLFALR